MNPIAMDTNAMAVHLTPAPPGIPSPPTAQTPPVSTPLPAAAAATPALQTSVSPSSLSPLAAPFRPAGCSKEARWSNSSPVANSGSREASPTPRSFRDVVVASLTSAAPEPTRPSPVAHKPRIVLCSVVHRPSPGLGTDEEGWTTVESKRARWFRHPRRPVPADLLGLCFNCFSPSYRDVVCRSRPRCLAQREDGLVRWW